VLPQCTSHGQTTGRADDAVRGQALAIMCIAKEQNMRRAIALFILAVGLLGTPSRACAGARHDRRRRERVRRGSLA
jgi:hypothetical protein